MIHVGRLHEEAATRHIPLSVLFEVTYRCNLACVHCYLAEGPADRPGPPKNELELPEIRRILGELAEAGTFFVTFSGGEVFLRRDFLDIVAAAKALGFCVFVFTAGTLLNEERAERLAALAPFAVEASVYSRRPDVHDAITKVPGSHARTLAALRRLRARGVQIVIKTPLMAPNADEWHGLVELADELGAEYGFDPIVIPRRDGDRTPLQYALDRDRLVAFARDPLLGQFVGGTTGSACESDDAICSSGRSTCRISPYGDVFPCAVSVKPAGNLRAQNFREVWERSPYLGELRRLTLKDLRGVAPDDPRAGGYRCSALAEQEDGDILGRFRRGERIAEAFRMARTPEPRP